jgi:hypothetical protein
MIALLATIILCGIPVNISSPNGEEKRVNPLIVAGDLLTCYSAYDALIKKVSAPRTNGKFLDGPAEYTAYLAACLGTKVVTACGLVVTEFDGTFNTAKITEFKAACAVTAPKDDTAKCLDSYNALIAALEKLSKKRKNMKLKAAVTEYQAFLDECPTTTQSSACSAKIAGILPATGPVASNLKDIKETCSVSVPPPPESADLYSIKTSSMLLLIITGLLGIFWVN